ncbi:MAG: hypothetical protein H7Z43_12160 [Clostridia bacterium]|nr:hypothetical protein [Deltaproteobacteria bacterium]
MRWFTILVLMSGCVSSTGLSDEANGDGNSAYTRACTAIVNRFIICGTPMTCAFTQDAVTDCEAQLAKEPNANLNAILTSSCDSVNIAICSDPAYAQYCSC